MLLASHIFEALCVNVPLLVPRDCEAAMCPLSVSLISDHDLLHKGRAALSVYAHMPYLYIWILE
jgi:hypothetical protein